MTFTTSQENIMAAKIDTTDNIFMWDLLSPADRKFTKKITGKSYSGDSPNPTYVVRKLTEVLGPIGVAWGFTVVQETVRYGRPHKITTDTEKTFDADGKVLSEKVKVEIIREEMHQVEIEFWQMVKDRRQCFSAFGGTPMLYLSKSNNWVHDEDAAKKSLTDAVTKAASQLGTCADIFLGVFDTKYSSPDDAAPPANDAPQPGAGVTPKNENRSTSTPDGW